MEFSTGLKRRMSTMKLKPRPPIILVALCLIAASSTLGGSKVLAELIGTWNFTSMTSLKDGKPFGTINFQPGQWTVTFSQDSTWIMKTPSNVNPRGLSGFYEVHGQAVDMKLANGKPYYKYHLAFEQDGKVLVLTGKGSINRASRE